MISHRGSKEGCVAEDIEDVLAGRHENRFALTDVDTVDIGIAPQTDHDDERITMKVNLLSHLHHHAMHHEMGTVDEL